MIQNLSEVRWFRVSLLIGCAGILCALWLWMSAYIYLELSGLNGKDATLKTLYQYWYYYGSSPETGLWLSISCISSFLVIGLFSLIFLIPKKRPHFGNAKWASQRDIMRAGLRDTQGIVVGQTSSLLGLNKRFLVYGGSQHVLMSAPTRSGKGVSVVIPTLLTWHDSVVIVDLKQENWDITAGFRAAHGQECYFLNFAPRGESRSHRWNPLDYVSDDHAFRVNDIQKIGNMLFPPIDNEPPIWQSSARSLWLGIVLYLFETEGLPRTLGEALRQVLMGDAHLAKAIHSRQNSTNPLSNECYLAIKDYLNTPDKTRGSIRKSFLSPLEPLYNPIIDAATSESDFDLRDLRKKRMSIYVVITPDDLERLSPLVNIFFKQVIDQNTRELPEQNPELKYQCLLLLDEFTALGKIGILSKSIGYIAGYGLRSFPIIQSPAQLRDVYGADASETFIENHALQVIFAPKSIKIAKEISETLGTSTVKKTSKSKQLTGKQGRSENASDHARPLLLPQEAMDIGQDAEIIIAENTPPILCKKITWYKEDILKKRGNNLRALAEGKKGVTRWESPDIPRLELSGRGISNINPDDIDNNTDHLNQDDLDKIDIPQGKMNENDIDNATDAFFDAVKVEKA